jgi:2-polyprenyl-3-methyl-5-hydroxy-6-metoxy-1,4-benzoquinol methylase
MLARFIWPFQRYLAQHRWSVDALILIFIALIVSFVQVHSVSLSAFSLAQKIAVSGALLVMWYAAGRVGSVSGAGASIMIGLLTAFAFTAISPVAVTFFCLSWATLLTPWLYELRHASTHTQALHAFSRSAVMIVAGAALLAPAWFALGSWPLLSGAAITLLASLFLPMIWCRLSNNDQPILPMALAPRVAPLSIARLMQGVMLFMVALGNIDIIGQGIKGAEPLPGMWMWVIPLVTLMLWHGITGQLWLSLVIVLTSLGWLGYAFFGAEPRHHHHVLVAFLLAQLLPFALWLARAKKLRWPPQLLLALGILPALGLENHFLAIGGASLAPCVALAIFAFRPLPTWEVTGSVSADTALDRARRAFQRMLPYWRYYGTAKLRFDPVYRQLAGQEKPWGRILDAGCGPGLIASLAAARNEPSYVGIDLDREKLDAAADVLLRLHKPLGQHYSLIHAQLPLTAPLEKQFDTIFLLDVLHYWTAEEQEQLLTQLHAQLDANGTLWLRDGVSDDAGNTGTVGFGEKFTTFFGLNPGNGLYFLSEPAMRALLEKTGFTVLSCEPSGKENRLWRCNKK